MLKILFLSPWYPYPADNGAKIRITNLLRVLSTKHRVTLIAACDEVMAEQPIAPELEALCERIRAVPWSPGPVQGIRRVLSYPFVSLMPEWAISERAPILQAAIHSELRATQYDLVIAYELFTAIYVLPHQELPPCLLEDLELGGYHSALEPGRPILRRMRGHVYWSKFRRAVMALLPRFSACTVPSEMEQRLLYQIAPGFPNQVVPNCIDYAHYQSTRREPQPNSLIFTGSLTYPVNFEAMKFFVGHVLPRIQAEIPDIHLTITGRHNQLPLPIAPSDAHVTLTGLVDDVRSWIAGSWVTVVPLLSGGGTRLKILEAMALGTPVVATSKGAEGLDVEHGRHLLIADGPEDLAKAVIRLCRDVDLHARLASEARRLVAERYDWSVVGSRYLDLIKRVASREPRRASIGMREDGI